MPTAVATAALTVFALLTEPASDFSPDKQRDLRLLIALMGSADYATQMLPELVAQLRKAKPEVSETFCRTLVEDVRSDDLVELLLPIYDRHFKHGEVKQLIALYSSPIGKKLRSELPALVRESSAAGQEWGRAIVKHALEKLQSSGAASQAALALPPEDFDPDVIHTTTPPELISGAWAPAIPSAIAAKLTGKKGVFLLFVRARCRTWPHASQSCSI